MIGDSVSSIFVSGFISWFDFGIEIEKTKPQIFAIAKSNLK